MDVLGKALMCAGLVFVLTDSVKRAVPAKLPPLVLQLLAFAIGIGVVFLVGASVWAHSEVINNVALDRLNAASKLVAGLLIGGTASVIDRLGFVQSREQGK